ncbi:MAG: sialate O-acetylesterase, partial [Verrucomicrobia bacterium]|nr:sialate O-acetylesterase [Verrucomicrobiota bacterium]
MKYQRLISVFWQACAVGGACLVSALSGRAEVRLPALFSDHAVIQQGMAWRVWGWADPGEQVIVEFRKQKATIQTPASGRWEVALKSEEAGGPDLLKVTGKNALTLNDVMVGEVWVASGQSNMELALSRSFEVAGDIAASANPQIRHFNVTKAKAEQPLTDVKGAWQLAGPETVAGFSAVGYYFSRDLQKALKVPVGVVHTSWGGSPAEVWMSAPVLAANPDYKHDILDAYPEQKRKFDEAVAKWEKDKAAADKEGQPFKRLRPRAPWKPVELYNAMIAPLIPYAIKGAIWYQGEANAGRAWQYRTVYADMIRNWRKDWGLGDFTFLGVQLAPFDHSRKRSIEEITASPTESTWAELREAQALSTKVLKNCGLAVITDVGDKDDIHPTRKAPVGARLALQARKIAYGENIVASGPTFKAMSIKEGKAILSFDNARRGLEVRGGPLTGFAVC